jgi:hypothetical protein
LRFDGWAPITGRGTRNVLFTHLHRLWYLPAVRHLLSYPGSTKEVQTPEKGRGFKYINSENEDYRLFIYLFMIRLTTLSVG